MAVVTAFNTLANTTDAGITAYFRAPDCTALTIADMLPILSKITAYEDEYVIGEMKIWDTGSESSAPNNCAVVHMMVYNDGWIVAWFEGEAKNQGSTGGCGYVNSTTLDLFGAFIEYNDQWNECQLIVESSSPTDPECPDGTTFTIYNSSPITGQIQVYTDYSPNQYHFNTGHTYTVRVEVSNGNLAWWGHNSNTYGSPPNMSNRLYRAIVEMWSVLRFSSNTTDVTDTAISKAFLYDNGSFTDYTTAFNSTSTNDVPLIPVTEAVDDAFYFGYEYKFNGITLDMGVAGVGGTIAWEYWNGSVWTSLVVTDLTSGFTVLTNHIHKADDTTNPVTSGNATNQTNLNTLLNEIKADYNAHRVSTTFHDAVDSTNVVASADATDLASSITLANEIKVDYNLHRNESGVHPYDDENNGVSAANGTDLATTIVLANEIKEDYNNHLVATQVANAVTFTPPDDWAKTIVNGSDYFWIRSRVSVAAFSIQPLLTQGWVKISDSLEYTNNNLGMYSFEDTGANYCLICGITYHSSGTTDRYFYNTPLLGKTIYSHSIGFGYRFYDSTSYASSSGNEFVVNGSKVWDRPFSYNSYNSNGYIIMNIESIDTVAGIQNAFWMYSSLSGPSGRNMYTNMSAVLITS